MDKGNLERLVQVEIDDRTGAMSDLCSYWQVTAAELIARIVRDNPEQASARSWLQSAPRTPDEFDKYYTSASNYILDLLIFNCRPEYWNRLMDCSIGRQLIDFGGGIGSTSILLASVGKDVTYVDLSSPQRDFAAYRFKRHGFDVCMANSLKGLKADTIMAIDVVEHIHPQRLPGLVRQFLACLPNGGQVHALCGQWLDPRWPQHQDTQEKFIDLMGSHGFTGGSEHWTLPTGRQKLPILDDRYGVLRPVLA